jgi:monothiol glutaredoxin
MNIMHIAYLIFSNKGWMQRLARKVNIALPINLRLPEQVVATRTAARVGSLGRGACLRAQLSTKTRAIIENAVKAHPLVLFMKGTPARPECGFSRAVIQAMEMNGVPEDKLTTFNVLQDQELRTGIKEFSYDILFIWALCLYMCSDWPTIPQVYVGGEFVGGCDIVLGSVSFAWQTAPSALCLHLPTVHQSGELEKLLEAHGIVPKLSGDEEKQSWLV